MCEKPTTHTPCAPSPFQEPNGAAGRLVSVWLSLLIGGTELFRAQQAVEARAWIERQLAAGWTEDQLAADMRRADRPSNEWPREWAARLGPKPPKVAQTPAEREIERQRATEERRAEEERLRLERAEWAASGIPSFLEFVKRKFAAAAGQAPPLPTGKTVKDPPPPAPADGAARPAG